MAMRVVVESMETARTAGKRMKSTGWRSQNSHAWGHCSDIAEQLTLSNRPITKRNVMDAMRGELVEDRLWPEVEHPLFRNPQPMDWSEADSMLANVMVEKLHAFADLHGLYLTEYIEEVAQKVWYGRKS